MSGRHDNNFTALRFVAASSVIVAHAYDLQGVPGLQDPFARLTGFTLGWLGVTIFFVMSGYLISMSLQRTPNLIQFAKARALRIYPGLGACLILLVLLSGLFITTMPAWSFFTNRQTMVYLAGNISLLSIHHTLPGVFEHNPSSAAVNGSIWTLPFEVGCYFMAAGLTVVGLLKSRVRVYSFLLLSAASLAFVLIEPHYSQNRIIARLALSQWLASCFLMGMAYASFADRVKLRWWYAAAMAACAWLLSGTPLYQLALSSAVAILTLWLAFVPSTALRRISHAPDYSYGIYIYAFPIQQALLLWVPELSPPLHALVAFLLVLIPASLSWHLIEKPALRLKHWPEGKPPAAPQDRTASNPSADVNRPDR